ncbi:MAG: hypothetical protein EOM47_01250 [Bacteroidia bacterium]|nr:hypothetical protein [Bacteroidia bacterium]
MAIHDYNNPQVFIQGKPVDTKPIKYEAPKTGNHIEFYNLSKKYEKLLSKLLRLSNKEKIDKNIDDFIFLATETKRILIENYQDAYLYFRSIDDMINTLTTFKQKNI